MKNKNQKIDTTFIHKIAPCTFGILLSTLFASHVFASSINTDNVLDLINQERASRGISKLVLNNDLNNAAALKSKDMINRDYFEHFAFGSTPWDFIKNAGYNYLYAGENLAMDFNTSEGMVRAWMNSPAHRENILNPDFRDVGVGIVKGEFAENNHERNTTIVTNMFGRKKPAILKVYDYITKNLLDNIF
jgi:uncharacterized protein YkwD